MDNKKLIQTISLIGDQIDNNYSSLIKAMIYHENEHQLNSISFKDAVEILDQLYEEYMDSDYNILNDELNDRLTELVNSKEKRDIFELNK